MQLGLIGLGKMGNNMRTRLKNAGHEVVGYDTNPQVSDVADYAALAAALEAPRQVWIMVPAGRITDSVVDELAKVLEPGDLVIDGGNTKYTDDHKHAAQLHDLGIDFMDVGVSGGVWGVTNGYGLMVGGSDDQVERMLPIFDALRPEGPREEGFVHAGGVGAGHFAKMVHNGVEYGLMQAYAEDFELLEAVDVVSNVPAVLKAWQRGTVVRSWLLELLVAALDADPKLARLRGWVQDSGEGRWTVQEVINHAVPAPVISAALFARFASRQPDSPAMRAVAALRHQFGGHDVQAAGPDQSS
jgi:6-phosphogluconate dehydrogenase